MAAPGRSSDVISALPGTIRPLRDRLRALGGVYISAQFTLVPGHRGTPLIAAHLKQLRPFLGPGDFEPGAFGHALVEELARADYTIGDDCLFGILPDAFGVHVLRALEIDTLIIGGIVTNGGVASTLRDAHLRNIHTDAAFGRMRGIPTPLCMTQH